MSTFKPQFRPNTQDEFIWKEVYEDNCYRLPDDMAGITVIDIGANVGAFAVSCLERGAEQVFCFEPDIDSYQTLRHNLTQFGEGAWSSVNCAVVGDSRKSHLYLSSAERRVEDGVVLTGGRNIFATTGENISYTYLSGFLSGRKSRIWLKLDCEGSEYEILLSNLPWDRIERVFGECHTLIDGKISRDTQPVNIDLGTIEVSYNTVQQRLEEVGYRVEMVPNSEDPHLHLFFADREEHKETKNVVVLTPFRNARKYLPLYFEQMSALKVALGLEGMSLRIVAAEGDSLDGTRERLIEMAREYNIPLSVIDTTHGHMRWGSVEDPVRMRVMSDVMNAALGQVRDTDDVVVWIMSDLEWDTKDVVGMILAVADSKVEFDILSPLAVLDSDRFYDTWAYRKDGKRFNVNWPFCENLQRGRYLLEIDSAGSCLVMGGEVARDCRADEQEAVSFCQNARDKGYRIALGTGWSVVHGPALQRAGQKLGQVITEHFTPRILWISDAVCYSGFSRVAHAMFPVLSEAGYEIDIVALNYWGWPHNYPYTIWPANVNGDDPGGKLRMQMLVKSAYDADRQYDVIVALDDPWNVPGISSALENLEKNHGVSPVPPVIAWVTTDGKNTRAKDLGGTYVVCATGFGLEEIARDSDFIDGKVSFPETPRTIVNFGVDTSIFRPIDRTESRSLVSSKEVPLDAYIVGTVSTNQLRKRLDLVIAYFAEWVKNHRVDNAYLYLRVSGSNDSGCDIPPLIRYYGLQKRVILNTSTLNDTALAHVYSAFDVFLSLPLGEGFGMTALESMACGTPCVVSDNSGYSSWIPDDCAEKIPCTSTMLSAPLNSQAYVIGGVADKRKTVAALHALYTFPDVRKEYSRKGLELARSMSWKNTGDKLLSVIEGVITKSKSGSITVHERKLASV